jgi:hypothetical protein
MCIRGGREGTSLLEGTCSTVSHRIWYYLQPGYGSSAGNVQHLTWSSCELRLRIACVRQKEDILGDKQYYESNYTSKTINSGKNRSLNEHTECRHICYTYPQTLELTSPTSGSRYISLADSGHGVRFLFVLWDSSF